MFSKIMFLAKRPVAACAARPLHLAALCLGLGFGACTPQATEGGEAEAAPSVAIGTANFKEGDTLSHYLTEVSYLRLKLPPGLMVGEVNKILAHQGTLYLLDKQKAKRVFAFDQAGNLLRTYGEPGEGPGQLNRAEDFLIDPQSQGLLLLDGNKQLVNVFHLATAKYIEARPLDFSARAMAHWQQGYAFHGSQRGDRLIFTDTAFARKASYLPYNGKNGSGVILHFTSLSPERVLFRTSFCDTIFEVSSGVPKPHLVINFGKHSFTHKHFDDLPAAQQQNFPQVNLEEFMTNIIHYQEMGDYRCFAFRYKNNMHYAFHQKGGGGPVVLSPSRTVNDVNFGRYFPAPLSNSQDGFLYSVISPEAKQSVMEAIGQMPQSVNGQKLMAQLQETDAASGPIIVKYKLALPQEVK